jgi:hypothetical protein
VIASAAKIIRIGTRHSIKTSWRRTKAQPHRLHCITTRRRTLRRHRHRFAHSLHLFHLLLLPQSSLIASRAISVAIITRRLFARVLLAFLQRIRMLLAVVRRVHGLVRAHDTLSARRSRPTEQALVAIRLHRLNNVRALTRSAVIRHRRRLRSSQTLLIATQAISIAFSTS